MSDRGDFMLVRHTGVVVMASDDQRRALFTYARHYAQETDDRKSVERWCGAGWFVNAYHIRHKGCRLYMRYVWLPPRAFDAPDSEVGILDSPRCSTGREALVERVK